MPPCGSGGSGTAGGGGMLSGKIESVRLALGELAGRVHPDQWALIASCRRELDDARGTAEMIETGLAVPGAPFHGKNGRAKNGEVVQ